LITGFLDSLSISSDEKKDDKNDVVKSRGEMNERQTTVDNVRKQKIGCP
jgi:hypothetical protein